MVSVRNDNSAKEIEKSYDAWFRYGPDKVRKWLTDSSTYIHRTAYVTAK